MMCRALFLLLLAALLTGCETTKKRVARQKVLSPIGRYLVTADTPPDGKPGLRNIVISRPGEKGELLRVAFGSQAQVVWAPDESALAIVDAAPTQNRILIFGMPHGKQLFELRKEDTCRWNPQLPCGADYLYGFFLNLVWLAPDQIQVSVEMQRPQQPGLPPEVRGVVVADFPLQ